MHTFYSFSYRTPLLYLSGSQNFKLLKRISGSTSRLYDSVSLGPAALRFPSDVGASPWELRFINNSDRLLLDIYYSFFASVTDYALGPLSPRWTFFLGLPLWSFFTFLSSAGPLDSILKGLCAWLLVRLAVYDCKCIYNKRK